MAAPVILVEATPRSPVDGAAATVRLAGGGAEVPYAYGGEHWRAGIARLPSAIASLNFDGEQLGGGGVPQALELSWSPGSNAALDNLASLFWTDAPIIVRVGPEDPAYTLPPIDTTGLVLEVAVENGTLRIALADLAADLKRPVLVDRFAGTGGIEGPTEFTGLIKSRAWGRCFNVPGRLLDKATQIWCFGDPKRQWQAFDQIRDKGVAASAATLSLLAWQGTTEATFAALQGAHAVEGGGVECPSIACVKWWTEPAGDLHADIRGETGIETGSGYVETAPQIAARIVAARSTLGFAPGAVAAASAARPAPCGWRIDSDGTTAADSISDLLGGVSLSWLLVSGAIEFRRWEWTAPTRVARSYRVTRTKTFKPVTSRKLGYRRNWAPMARGDLAAIVLSTDVLYEDGTPIEDLKPAALGADVTGNNTAKDTTAVGGVPTAVVVAKLDRIAPIEARFDPIESDISAIKDAKIGTDQAIGALLGVNTDQSQTLQQITRDAGRLNEAMLRLLSEADHTRIVLRDAGFVVDPLAGTVRIYAVDQQAERLSQAEVNIAGQAALITLKASVNYVQEQIALAVLDPTQVADLNPLIARLSSAELAIDGLNALITQKAAVVDVTALGGRVTTAQELIDALQGQIVTKVDQTTFDALATDVGSVQETLQTLGNVSSFSVDIRQARAVEAVAGEAMLLGLIATNEAIKRQIAASAQIRQELYAKVVDGFSAEAVARTALSVQIGLTDARALSETTARITQGGILSQRIDAVGVTNDEQAAAIGRIDAVSIANGKGVAGTQVTIRQQGRDGDANAEALLASLVAGDSAAQRINRQLVQFQSEVTTTLVANESASASARQALIARLGLAEAATETVSQVLADTEQSLVSRLEASEAVFNDPVTGLAATRARAILEETNRATAVKAVSDRLVLTDAKVNDPATGLAATYASVGEKETASVTRDAALGQRITDTNATVYDPDTGVARTAVRVTEQADASAGRDTALGYRIDNVTVTINDPATGLAKAHANVADERQARIDANGVLAGSINQVSTTVNGHTATLTAYGQSIDGIKLRYGVTLDSGGRATGFQILGGPATSSFIVSTDYFRIEKPEGGQALEYIGGTLKLTHANGQLAIRMGVW